MSSKEQILQNIRNNNIVKDTELPSYSNFGIKFDDKYSKFTTMLESVGGKALVINKNDLDDTIKKLYPDETIIASNVEECKLGNFNSNKGSSSSRSGVYAKLMSSSTLSVLANKVTIYVGALLALVILTLAELDSVDCPTMVFLFNIIISSTR